MTYQIPMENGEVNLSAVLCNMYDVFRGTFGSAKDGDCVDILQALVSHERERCARVAEDYVRRCPGNDGDGYWAAGEVARTIRAKVPQGDNA